MNKILNNIPVIVHIIKHTFCDDNLCMTGYRPEYTPCFDGTEMVPRSRVSVWSIVVIPDTKYSVAVTAIIIATSADDTASDVGSHNISAISPEMLSLEGTSPIWLHRYRLLCEAMWSGNPSKLIRSTANGFQQEIDGFKHLGPLQATPLHLDLIVGNIGRPTE